MNLGQGLTEKKGLSGAFFTGVLAVVVASPCTAPFMGTALGYAVTQPPLLALTVFAALGLGLRSEEHTSELQSLMRISYAVFCLKKKKQQKTHTINIDPRYNKHITEHNDLM